MIPIFVPAYGKRIAEFPVSLLFDNLPAKPCKKLVEIKHEGQKYVVNFGNDRYLLFKNNPRCSCCGIHINRMFLEYDEQNSQEAGEARYVFHLYAETGDGSKDNTLVGKHYVQMNRDHIVSRINGGPDEFENYQTMCYNCNSVKGEKLTAVEVRQILFPAYRAYKSSYGVRKAQEHMKKWYDTVDFCDRGISRIEEGLPKVLRSEAKEAMLKKRDGLKNWKEHLQKELDRIELLVQTTGDLRLLDTFDSKEDTFRVKG